MNPDLFDDDVFAAGNVGPCFPPWLGGLEEHKTSTTPTAPREKDAFKEQLTDLQAMFMDEIFYGGYQEEDVKEAPSVATADRDDAEGQVFRFMDLPYEIRLQVYKWVHLMHPVKQAQLTSWYPTPAYSAYFLKAVFPDLGGVDDWCDNLASMYQQQDERLTRAIDEGGRERRGVEEECKSEAGRTETNEPAAPLLLSPYRPYSRMPTALLRASSQVYGESRQLPFADNEFVFVNWFASGLWAARSFMKGLRPWQRGLMRYARLELLSRDLTGLYADEWRELCGFWSEGLRGLRLKIMSGGGAFGSWLVENNNNPPNPNPSSASNGAGGAQKGVATIVEVREPGGKLQGWVESGLRLLRQLRCLEVELGVSDWDNAKKLQWCRELQESLNEARAEGEGIVRVICVEQAVPQ